ncbi:MAG: hypothetical protein NTZ17_02465 [Phycisphaerae bacterium]|nr:hypothetical protein [Phycisphaerae bacterium]
MWIPSHPLLSFRPGSRYNGRRNVQSPISQRTPIYDEHATHSTTPRCGSTASSSAHYYGLPYRIELTEHLKKDKNDLVLVVSNSVANRFAWDIWGTRGDAKTEPSGLLGPVQVLGTKD